MHKSRSRTSQPVAVLFLTKIFCSTDACSYSNSFRVVSSIQSDRYDDWSWGLLFCLLVSTKCDAFQWAQNIPISGRSCTLSVILASDRRLPSGLCSQMYPVRARSFFILQHTNCKPNVFNHKNGEIPKIDSLTLDGWGKGLPWLCPSLPHPSRWPFWMLLDIGWQSYAPVPIGLSQSLHTGSSNSMPCFDQQPVWIPSS